MSYSVDSKQTDPLLTKVQQNALDFVELNKSIEEFRADLQKQFYLIAQDHQKQLNLRLKLFEQLQLLVGVTESSGFDDVRNGNGGFYELDGQPQEAEALATDKYFNFTGGLLGKLMSQHYERMKGLADAHGKLLCQERELLVQLRIADLNKNSLLTRLHRQLDELQNDHCQQLPPAHENLQHMLTVLHEKEYQLVEANKKLAESAAKNNELSTELARCVQQLQKDGEEKNNSLAQLKMQLDGVNNELKKWRAENHELTEKLRKSKTKLQNSRELAYMTKLRQLKELDMTETISAIVSRLQERNKAAMAGNIPEQDNVMRSGDLKDNNETGEPKHMVTKSIGLYIPDHLQRLRENHQQLTELLEARKVAAFMFEHDALTIRELQSIQQRSTPFEAAEALLEIIWELGKEVQVYEYFMKALQKTNQQHIWSWLSYTDFDIDCKHVQLIRNHYSILVETIEHSGLIALLFSRGVIDVQDRDYLEAEMSCVRRNEKLLSMLGRKSEQQFDLFLICLNDTGQRHVAMKLRGNLDSPDNTSGEHPLAFSQVQHTTDRLPTDTSASHVISSKGGGEVFGLTVCDEKLFVLRELSERIEHCDMKSFDELGEIRVDRLSDKWWWGKSLTSCHINNCLYVNDHRSVFRVLLPAKEVISWQIKSPPCGLSVNRKGYVLVTCYYVDTILEYSASGSLVRLIKLQVNHVTLPSHTVQLTDGRYVVSHLGPVDGVSLIDQRGALITSYRNSETAQLVNFPRWIVVLNDCILVADRNNNRILSLNSSLNVARELSLPVDTRLSGPCCMYFDQSSGRLFVGEHAGEYRVLVFDNIQWT